MIEKYEHHGKDMYVKSHLKGKHKEHCLCYECKNFKPNEESNCILAECIFKNCKTLGVVTPVWECMSFVEKD